MLELIFLEGSQKRRNIRLNFQKAWFGREPTCDFVIDEKGVSRNHFVIQKRGENYILTDNQSTNGTFVDGLRIVEMVIRPGQQIIAGANLIQVRELAEEHAEFRFIAEWKATTGVAQILEKSKILLGRKNTCDIQLDEPAISHAIQGVLRVARQKAVTTHTPIIVAFGNGSTTTDITTYTVHSDTNSDRIKQSGEPWVSYTLPSGTKLETVSLRCT